MNGLQRFLEKTWWLVLLVILGGMVYAVLGLPRLRIDSDVGTFLEKESAKVTAYYEAREEWGTDEFAVFCISAENWFTPEGIATIEAVERDLRAVPCVGSTLSILDLPLLRQNPDERPSLIPGRWRTPTLREDGVDLAAAEAELREHRIAVGNLISEDGRSVNILAYLDWTRVDGKLDPPAVVRKELLVRGVREVAEKWNGELEQPVRLSGVPIIQMSLYESMRGDLIVLLGASMLLFALSFAIIYRRVRFVLLPLACCLLTPLAVLGVLAWTGKAVGFVTSLMPVLLFVLMLPYSVYFIEAYRERRAGHPYEDGFTSSLRALRAILVPCFFSWITTLAGFSVLAASRILPIQDFGRSMVGGMAGGFLLTVVFLATISRRLPGIEVKDAGVGSRGKMPRWVKGFERFTLARPGVVLVLAGLVLVASGVGLSRLSVESKFSSYFWPGSEVYEGLEYIDREMGGTTWIEVFLRSDDPGYFRSAEGLRALELVEEYFDEVEETGNIMSLVALRDEVRKALRPDWFPWMSDGLVLLTVGAISPDLVGQTTSKDFRSTRTTVRMMETMPTLNRQRVLSGLQAHLAAHPEVFGDLKVEVTGIIPVYAELLNQLMVGQRESVLAVAIAVFVMLLLLFRSPGLAFVVLVAQAFPVCVVLGLIGWLGIPLDLVTVMIAAIALGVGVDASIQYTMRYRGELLMTGDRREALSRSHATIGRAIWIATTVIIAGFLVLVFSNFFPSVWFGLFTALAMLIGQLTTLTVLPALFLRTPYPRDRSI